MTENKRFTIKDSMLKDGYVIIDNEKEYTFPVLDSTLNYMFCKALNELHKEKEQLKDALNQRTDQCDEYYKENEQLKKELNTFKPIIFEDTNGGSSILYEKVEE